MGGALCPPFYRDVVATREQIEYLIRAYQKDITIARTQGVHEGTSCDRAMVGVYIVDCSVNAGEDARIDRNISELHPHTVEELHYTFNVHRMQYVCYDDLRRFIRTITVDIGEHLVESIRCGHIDGVIVVVIDNAPVARFLKDLLAYELEEGDCFCFIEAKSNKDG